MTNEDKTIPDVYTNNIRMTTNIYEVMLIIGLTSPEADGSVSQKDIIKVRMSPQEAMALSIMLNKQLELYKDTYKEIFLPDEIIKSLKGEKIVETVGEQ